MELPEERLIKLIKDHLDIDISHEVNDFENTDCAIYEDSSADGYSLYIVTNNISHISICEDVYYYEHHLTDAFEEQIRYGDQTFYIEASIYDDSYFDDKLVSIFVDHVEDIIKDENLDITLKEINQLKEEYGIEDEEEEPETA